VSRAGRRRGGDHASGEVLAQVHAASTAST
jgi:hypothetical protein